ncbi:phosphatase PAP2 family protein [Peribacillus muralis]|uniref:phosphatase PAP2 family protein n=1 Tax=Peribacillus muralis TaxID=264697 RepID=UPI001F4E0214|nr:phosphatase PAP2 family protein [Peribacillus muralis]MCK1992919.1 phosphatase PAP2 family protein [Peribacillus muralis]MCK2013474.1 phosphatase PAP2 family protein [Peribacillus muralis]
MIKHSWIAAVLLCLMLFFLLVHEVRSERILALDTYLAFEVDEHTLSFSFLKYITLLGKSVVIGFGSILIILYLWIVKKDYLLMAVFSIGMGGVDLLNRTIKNQIQRQRPDDQLVEASGFSFPSGHAMVGIVFYSILAYLIIKEVKRNTLKWVVGIGFTFLILLIGLSRISMNVHFPTDVLAGYALGGSFTIVLINLYKVLGKFG